MLLALFGCGVASLSYALAIVARKNTSMFYMVSQSVALPMMLLGGVLLPFEGAPPWLIVLSRLNPLTYLVEGERALFRGEMFTTEVLFGALVAVLTAVVGLWVGGQTIEKARF